MLWHGNQHTAITPPAYSLHMVIIQTAHSTPHISHACVSVDAGMSKSTELPVQMESIPHTVPHSVEHRTMVISILLVYILTTLYLHFIPFTFNIGSIFSISSQSAMLAAPLWLALLSLTASRPSTAMKL